MTPRTKAGAPIQTAKNFRLRERFSFNRSPNFCPRINTKKQNGRKRKEQIRPSQRAQYAIAEVGKIAGKEVTIPRNGSEVSSEIHQIDNQKYIYQGCNDGTIPTGANERKRDSQQRSQQEFAEISLREGKRGESRVQTPI